MTTSKWDGVYQRVSFRMQESGGRGIESEERRTPSYMAEKVLSPDMKLPQAVTSNVRVVDTGLCGTSRYRLNFVNASGQGLSPWHRLPLYSGKRQLSFVCTTTRGTTVKFEMAVQETLNPLKVVINSQGKSDHWPEKLEWNFGFLPQTWGDPSRRYEDSSVPSEGVGPVINSNDLPLDVVDIGSRPASAGEVYKVKPLAAFAVIDMITDRMSWKVVAIAITDPLANDINCLWDLEENLPGKLLHIQGWLTACTGNMDNVIGRSGRPVDVDVAISAIAQAHRSWTQSPPARRALARLVEHQLMDTIDTVPYGADVESPKRVEDEVEVEEAEEEEMEEGKRGGGYRKKKGSMEGELNPDESVLISEPRSGYCVTFPGPPPGRPSRNGFRRSLFGLLGSKPGTRELLIGAPRLTRMAEEVSSESDNGGAGEGRVGKEENGGEEVVGEGQIQPSPQPDTSESDNSAPPEPITPPHAHAGLPKKDNADDARAGEYYNAGSDPLINSSKSSLRQKAREGKRVDVSSLSVDRCLEFRSRIQSAKSVDDLLAVEVGGVKMGGVGELESRWFSLQQPDTQEGYRDFGDGAAGLRGEGRMERDGGYVDPPLSNGGVPGQRPWSDLLHTRYPDSPSRRTFSLERKNKERVTGGYGDGVHLHRRWDAAHPSPPPPRPRGPSSAPDSGINPNPNWKVERGSSGSPVEHALTFRRASLTDLAKVALPEGEVLAVEGEGGEKGWRRHSVEGEPAWINREERRQGEEGGAKWNAQCRRSVSFMDSEMSRTRAKMRGKGVGSLSVYRKEENEMMKRREAELRYRMENREYARYANERVDGGSFEGSGEMGWSGAESPQTWHELEQEARLPLRGRSIQEWRTVTM